MLEIFAIFCAVGLPVIAVIVLIVRLTSSTKKERLEMIRMGMIPPEKAESAPSRLRTLRAGMAGIGGGLGAILSFVILEFVYHTCNELHQTLIVLGTVFFFFGISFVIYYIISKGKTNLED